MPSKFFWEIAAEHDLVVCCVCCWQEPFELCCARKSSFGTKIPSEYDPMGKGFGQITLETELLVIISPVISFSEMSRTVFQYFINFGAA